MFGEQPTDKSSDICKEYGLIPLETECMILYDITMALKLSESDWL